MATFTVETIHITAIEPIPGADAIELAVIGPADVGYRSVIRKGSYQPGQVVAYIPEAALLPEWLINDLGLQGKLAGPAQNRVRAIRLRGCLSQGLVWVPPAGWDAWFRKYYPEVPAHFDALSADDALEDIHFDYAGYDLTEKLGIRKWTPDIPLSMAGDMNHAPEWMKPTDSENIKRVGAELVEGEAVIITEKVHGT